MTVNLQHYVPCTPQQQARMNKPRFWIFWYLVLTVLQVFLQVSLVLGVQNYDSVKEHHISIIFSSVI